MPVTTSFDARGLFVLTILDPMQPSDTVAALERLASHPQFQRGTPILLDRRSASPPTAAYVHEVSRSFRPAVARLGVARFAVLVSNPASYGMARMASALADPRDILGRIFWDYEDACRWLLAAPQPPPSILPSPGLGGCTDGESG